jgi:hypothetical protein
MAKKRASSQVPDRDARFQHINTTVGRFLADELPVVSVDAKKKEPIGDFARAGRTYRPRGKPITAPDHDFTFADTPVAIPYGVYDLGQDIGWVNVGTDRNTAAFAVEPIRRWWNRQGRDDYPDATRLLITADSHLFKRARSASGRPTTPPTSADQPSGWTALLRPPDQAGGPLDRLAATAGAQPSATRRGTSTLVS